MSLAQPWKVESGSLFFQRVSFDARDVVAQK